MWDWQKKKFKILELNGAGAEPAHIYDPDFSFITAYRILFHHWRVLYQISQANAERGKAFLSFREGIEILLRSRRYRKGVTERGHLV